MPKPEEKARALIDRQLEAAGWIVQDYKAMNIHAGPGVAIREFPLTTGHADYMLYVLFFDNKPAQEAAWTKKLWVYDLRTNVHFTQKEHPLQRADLDEFVKCYNPKNRHQRKATWSEKTPDGRWRVFDYDEIAKRDKVNLDIFWLKDQSLEDSDDLPDPDVLAQEIADDLQTALDQFQSIADAVKEK